jgi:hypothetical protein
VRSWRLCQALFRDSSFRTRRMAARDGAMARGGWSLLVRTAVAAISSRVVARLSPTQRHLSLTSQLPDAPDIPRFFRVTSGPCFRAAEPP